MSPVRYEMSLSAWADNVQAWRLEITADEVPDPQALGLRLWVNDVLRQKVLIPLALPGTK